MFDMNINSIVLSNGAVFKYLGDTSIFSLK